MHSEAPATPFLKRLKIEAFRGFNEQCEFDLDASAVVISGANGRGKTSLTDAIQWLLLGALPRLTPLKNRRNEEHIVNKYAEENKKLAVVEAIFSLHQGNEIVVRREGDHRNTLLTLTETSTVITGDLAQRRIAELVCGTPLELGEFERYILSTAILQQDAVRSFLWDSKAPERYELLLRLMGLEALQDFVDKVTSSVSVASAKEKDAKDRLTKLNEAVESLEGQRQNLASRSDIYASAPSINSILRGIASGGTLLSAWASDLLPVEDLTSVRLAGDLRQIDGEIRLLRDWIHEQSTLAQRVLVASVAQQEEEHRAAELGRQSAEAQLRFLEERVALAESAHEEARQKAAAFTQLANAAIGLLGPACPVCQQRIEPDEVATRLRSLIGESSQMAATGEALRLAQHELSTGRSQLREAELALRQGDQQLREAHRWARELDERVAAREAATDRLSRLSIEVPSIIRQWPREQAVTTEVHDEVIAWLAEAEGAIARSLATIEESAAASLLDQVQVSLRSMDQRISSTREQLNQCRLEVDSATRELVQRRELASQSKEATSEVVTSMFDELKPVVYDIFSRLAPHPTFTELSLTNEVYYGRGTSVPTAKDPQTGYEINPSTTFSSAQSNVVAICFFLAFAFSGTDIRFPFVILDDPLQSMDDINVLGFSDLCRFLRNHKQLIITTHERRLASLLVRKLTPRDLSAESRSIEFKSWDRRGPQIEIQYLQAEAASEVFSAS